MRKPILPIAAVLAVAPTLANAQDPNVISFDVSALKSSLYSVINTIGHQGQNDGYAQAVKDVYLVQTSKLENDIDAYYQKIVKGEVTSQDAADAKYKEFTDAIEKIRKDAAEAQAPYQKALDDAVAAVKADQEAYTAAQKAVEALSVPSVKATWEAELAKITLPTAPTRTDNIDANKKIASDAAAQKAAIEKLASDAKAADAAAVTAQTNLYNALKKIQTTALTNAASAATEIQKLMDNTGMADTYLTANAAEKTKAENGQDWMMAVEASKAAYTLDADNKTLTEQGNAIVKAIADNLAAAKKAATTAEDAEYNRIIGLIAEQENAFKAITVDKADTQTAKVVTEYNTKHDVAKLGADGFHKDGVSYKNKKTNEENVAALQQAVKDVTASVAGYSYYQSVKAAIKTAQDNYNTNLLRLTEALAGKDVYQDVYEAANVKLNVVANTIQRVTADNEALYTATPVSAKEAYDALIEKLNALDSKTPVDEALALFNDQEAQKKKADEAIAVAKKDVKDQSVLSAIATVETNVANEYKKHTLDESDYTGALGSVSKYAEQRAQVTKLTTNLKAIKADPVVFKTSIDKITADINTLSKDIDDIYAQGKTGEKATEVQTRVDGINTAITDLDTNAAAELKALTDLNTALDNRQKELDEATKNIKTNYSSVWEQVKADADKLQTRITTLRNSGKEAYTDAKEKAANPINTAVRSLDVKDSLTLKADIESFVTKAIGTYDDQVDKANTASYNQMVIDFDDINKKLTDATAAIAKIHKAADVNEATMPDYSAEIAALQAKIDEQKQKAEKARTDEQAAIKADKHNPTLVSLLETIDKVLYGESYPTTNEKNGGIWKAIEDQVSAAQANFDKTVAELKTLGELKTVNLKNLRDVLDAKQTPNLTDEQRAAYNKNADDAETAINGKISDVKTQYTSKKATVKENTAAIDKFVKDEKNYLDEKEKNDNYSQLELALNDDAHNRIVASIKATDKAFNDSIENAKINWSTQYSALSGIYSDATGFPVYEDNDADLKANLDKALAGYQKELSDDVTKLNALKEVVAKAKTDALADAEKCYKDKVSLECTADKDMKNAKSGEKALLDAVADVKTHIDETDARATKNRDAFKAELQFVEDLDTLVAKGKKDIADARADIANNTASGYTSEVLDETEKKLGELEKLVRDFQTNILSQHIALTADAYKATATEKEAELRDAMMKLKDGETAAYRQEIVAANNKVMEFTNGYAKDVKALYDKYLMEVESYKTFKHYDYTKEVLPVVEGQLFGIADSLRTIVADAETKLAEANKDYKYFDNKVATHFNQIEALKKDLEAKYAAFLVQTEKIAEPIYTKAVTDKKAEVEAAKTTVKGFTDKANALKVFQPIDDAIANVEKEAALVMPHDSLARETDGYINTLKGLDVANALNETLKTVGDSVVSDYTKLVATFTTKDYGTEAAAILQKAIDDANKLTTAATNSIAKSYTDKTLAKDLSGILATLKDVQTSLNTAKDEADKKQAEINADKQNQANYASFDMDGLRKKYTDAVATIKGYDEKVKSLFDVELSALGGDKLDGKGGNIQKLQDLLDAAKENNAWDNLENLKNNYKSLGEQIDDILARAKAAQESAIANSDYGKVGKLYQEVVSLIEPYNRAETNKDDTKEAADEASAIYKEIKSLLDELKGATDAYDAAKKTADTKDDEAANATLAAIVAKTSEYTAKIENLRTRITKLDKELTAYNELMAAYNALGTVDAAIEEATANFDTYKTTVADAIKATPAYTKAVADAASVQKAIEDSHALNRANKDKDELNTRIAALGEEIAALKTACQTEYEAEVKAAKIAANEAAFTALSKQLNDKKAAVVKAKETIAKDYPAGMAVVNEDFDNISKALETMETQLKADHDAVNLTAESKLDFTAVDKALNDALAKAKTAQEEADKANAGAVAEVTAAYEKLQNLYNEAETYNESIVDVDIKKAADEALQKIDITLDLKPVDRNNKQEFTDSIAKLTTAVQEAYDAAKAANEKWQKKGNLDGDDQLSIDDYSKLYDIVSGAKTPTEDEKYLADINCDGSVDVADLTELSRMMLKQATLEDIYVSKHGTDAKPFMSNTVEAEATTDGRAIAIALNNASNLVAMQADITLPEGVSIVNAAATLRAKGLNASVTKLADGKVRVMLYSVNNNLIEGTEGNVVKLNIDGVGVGDITLTNAMAVDAEGMKYTISDMTASTVTAIKSVTTDDSNSSLDGARIYNTAGAMLNKMRSGVNIIVNKAGKVVKVFKK